MARGTTHTWRTWARHKTAPLALLPLLVTAAASTHAADYSITIIDDGERISRDPVISDGGMVAWSSTLRDPQGTIKSDILVYIHGELKNLTADHPDQHSENIKPHVAGRYLAWVSSWSEPREGGASWNLRNVPDPHSPHRELNARYQVASAPDGAGGSLAVQSQVFKMKTNEVITATTTNEEGAVLTVPIQTNDLNEAVSRSPSGMNEICVWEEGSGPFTRISYDSRNDLAASAGSTGIVAYQKAKGYPFGWEIMIWQAGEQSQLTTNYYYDMAPRVCENLVVWYGWDGEDYEIYLYDHEAKTIEKITDNNFDDVSPEISGTTITWEGYPAVESDIYMWTRLESKVRKITDNPEDDINPRVWDDYIVWQSFDADDFEIWIYVVSTGTSQKLTNNGYDDVQPQIRDGVITWMGYHDNWDAEIFVGDLASGIDNIKPAMLTDNEYEDRDPQTASGRIVWLMDEVQKTPLLLAEPR